MNADWHPALLLGVAMGIASTLVLPLTSAMTGERLAGGAFARTGAENGVVGFLVAWMGLTMGAPMGLDAPLVRSWFGGEPFRGESHWLKAVLAGAVAAVAVLLFLKVFPPHGVTSVSKKRPTPWQGALASLSAGITEEIIFRLGLVTLFAWMLANICGTAAPWVFMTAITLAAVAFGASHLRLAAKLSASLSVSVVVATILANTFVGIVFGVLYWWWGLEHAIVAHVSADIVIHVIRPATSSRTD